MALEILQLGQVLEPGLLPLTPKLASPTGMSNSFSVGAHQVPADADGGILLINLCGPLHALITANLLQICSQIQQLLGGLRGRRPGQWQSYQKDTPWRERSASPQDLHFELMSLKRDRRETREDKQGEG